MAAAAIAGLSANGGCTTTQPGQLSGGTESSTGTSMSTTGTGAGGGMTAADPKELFAELEADFVAACASCHQPGGLADRPFLAQPDRYQSVISWPGIITKDPSKSLLLTYPVSGSGAHTNGKNLDAADLKTTLMPRIVNWLTAEGAAIAAPIDMAKPTIAPVAPIMGFNAIYLTPLDKELEGVAITFNANQLTEKTLELTDVQVHSTTKTGVHIVHPLFVVYPKNKDADPDPVDNFGGVDAYYDKNESGDLGQGTVLLTNWVNEAKLSIVFETVEPYTVGGGTGGAGGTGTATGGGCKDVAEFTASAQGRFQTSCFGCHGGGNAMANAAVDMSKLMTDPAAACGQIRNRVKPADAPNSQIFITTDPGGTAAHPFKFGGNQGQFDTFKSNVSLWIQAEQ
ncbi:MAG: hypothetical protein U0414_16700 [Polyangiaceae bacterium]